MRVRGLGMAGLGLAVASLLAAANARAGIDLIYSTDGVAPQPIGSQGDTIGLGAYSGSLELNHRDDYSAEGELNSVSWTRVPGARRSGTLTLTEDITVTLGHHTQDATLSYTFVTSQRGQSIMVEAGSPVILDLGSYLLTITPQDSTWYATASRNDLRRQWREPNKRDRDSTCYGTGMGDLRNRLNANFALTAVPEPTTMVAGAGALGLVVLTVFRSKRSGVIKIGA